MSRFEQHRLFGGTEHEGMEILYARGPVNRPHPWDRDLQRESLYLCLNLQGRGTVTGDVEDLVLEDRTAALFHLRGAQIRARRDPGEEHRFVLWRFERGFLKLHFGQDTAALREEVRVFLAGTPGGLRVGEIQPLGGPLEAMAWELLHPPVPAHAQDLWYRVKAQEVLALTFFQPADNTSPRLRDDLARRRARRVKEILNARLDQSVNLDDLAAEVGCSTFYLSRLFSRETGKTIPQYLRAARMERAAHLLRSGEFNVTEAALEVGYASLSHFSKAFALEHGITPRAFLRRNRH